MDIICSQVEIEQDQAALNPDVAVGNPMEVIDEEEEEEETGTMTTEAPRNAGWTRGPTQLKYDDDDDDVGGEEDDENNGGNEDDEMSQAADQEEQPSEAGEAGANDSGGKAPLRLRGGVGLPRTKAKSVRPTRSATAPEPTSSVPRPGGSTESGGVATPAAGNKRPAPALDPPTRRQAPLRAPCGLRRSVSTPGGTVGGGFKPPRPLYTAVKLAAVDQVGAAGSAAGDGDGDGDSAGSPSVDDPLRLGSLESLKTAAAPESSAGDGGSDDGDDGSDTQEESSNTEERSQVVVPGWESQGRHPVEYRGGHLSFVSTTQLRTSPSLARGLGGRTGSETSGTGSVGAVRKKQKVCEEEGGGSDGSADNEPAVCRAASGILDGGGTRGDAADSKPSSALAAGNMVKAPGSDTPSFGQESHNVDGGHLDIPPRADVDARQGQSTDNARNSPGSSSSGAVNFEGRFRRADARLGLATTTRGTRSPLQRRALGESAYGSVNDTTFSSPMVFARKESGAAPEKAGADQLGVRTGQVRDSNFRPSPSVGVARTQDSLEAPWRGQGQGQETEPAGGRLPNTDQRDNDSYVSSSPASASAATAGLASPTPPLPPASDWGRSPATPLSAQSDSSGMPPLGQPSPGLLTAATRDAAAAAGVGSGGGGGGGLPGAGSGGQRNVRDKGAASKKSPSTPGGFFLSAGGGSTAASPARGRFSGFTPPTPGPREGSRRSGTVVLRPFERPPAPDPAMCAAAMSRLGVLQVGGAAG